MAKLRILNKRPIGGVRVSTATSEKQAQKLAVMALKPGHRVIVRRGHLYDIYVV